MKDPFDNNYWEQRYINKETGWDAHAITTPLQTYFDGIADKNIRILIPGAGNSYEAEYLFNKGFKNITVVDFATSALNNIKNRVPDFPSEKLVCIDFFEHDGQYDLIVEQTFFCALHPNLREKYVQHMQQLLSPNGKLIGVLFNDTLNSDHPPFGGNKEEYEILFSKYFSIKKLELCYNSIAPRQGRELFIVMEKSTSIK